MIHNLKMDAKIYECFLGFGYSKYYVSVILIANDFNDAKNKFILKCLEKYNEINAIDFNAIDFNNNYENDGELLIKFKNILDFEKYLMDNINENSIECLETCKFEIVDKYE